MKICLNKDNAEVKTYCQQSMCIFNLVSKIFIYSNRFQFRLGGKLLSPVKTGAQACFILVE